MPPVEMATDHGGYTFDVAWVNHGDPSRAVEEVGERSRLGQGKNRPAGAEVLVRFAGNLERLLFGKEKEKIGLRHVGERLATRKRAGEVDDALEARPSNRVTNGQPVGDIAPPNELDADAVISDDALVQQSPDRAEERFRVARLIETAHIGNDKPAFVLDRPTERQREPLIVVEAVRDSCELRRWQRSITFELHLTVTFSHAHHSGGSSDDHSLEGSLHRQGQS